MSAYTACNNGPDGHNYVPKKTVGVPSAYVSIAADPSEDILEVFCTKCADVRSLHTPTAQELESLVK